MFYRAKKLIATILALLILLEPALLPVVRAGLLIPDPRLREDALEGLPDTDEIVPPLDYLNYILKMRGRSKKEVEARAWGEWMMTLNSAYMLVDDGSTDVMTFYQALKVLRENNMIWADIADVVTELTKYTTLGFTFLARTSLMQNSDNLILGFMQLTQMAENAQNWVRNNRILNFMEFATPPPFWSDPEATGKGFKSYWRWVRGRNTGAADAADELTKAQGIARSLGIGLTVLALAFDAYAINKSIDRKIGRNSYQLVKNYAGAILGLGSLVAMFCVPIIGQIVMVAGCIWAVSSFVGEVIGAYNRRWKSAYKASYWYLYENDPEFKSFYDNRAQLKTEEKAVSLHMLERRFEDFYSQTPKEGDSIEARNSRAYVSLEKQGVLVSYYSKKGFTLPDFGMERLQQLWEMKADFMSWKPTEAEAKESEEAGFWGKVGHYVNPITYVSWAGDKIKSGDYQETIKQYEISKVFFNPDYVLLKKYQNYLTARKLRGGIYDLVGLRVEQSPFNYIPLLGIDTSAWDRKLLEEAFAADGFIIGQKEIMLFSRQIELAAQKAEEFIDRLDNRVTKKHDSDLPKTKKIRAFLDSLLLAWQTDPERENERLFKDGRRIFDWDWNEDYGKKSPQNIIKHFKEDFEKTLFAEPLSLAQKAAETVILLTAVKQQLDIARIMQDMAESKQEALDKFDKNFKNYEIKRYLKEGSFLDIKGDSWADWFGQNYSYYDETKKYLHIFKKEIENYTGFADLGNSSTRERMFWFDKEITHPKELLRKLNSELDAWESIVEKFADINTDEDANIELNLPLYDDTEFAEKVFAEYELGYDLIPLDPNEAVEEVERLPAVD
jgi:hypothetical protein